jgi:hypothetical protein
MLSVHRHLQEGREVTCSNEEVCAARGKVVTLSDLEASDLSADGPLYAPFSKSGLLMNDCSCVKKGTRSESEDDS